MISLKEHNDLVDKFCKQLSVKEAEIKGLEKQVNKIPKQAPQIEPTASEVILNKKILQINKEHKEKVAALTLQLTAKDV